MKQAEGGSVTSERLYSSHVIQSVRLFLLALAVMVVHILVQGAGTRLSIAQLALNELVSLMLHTSVFVFPLWITAIIIHRYRQILALVFGILALFWSNVFDWGASWTYLIKICWIASVAVLVAGQAHLVMKGRAWSWTKDRPASLSHGLSWTLQWQVRHVNHTVLAIVLYLLSLLPVCYYLGDGYDPQGPGYVLLTIGWLGIIAGNVSWLGNPLLFFAVLTRPGKPRLSFVLGVLALLVMLAFLLYDDLLVNEGGGRKPITAYGWGYLLWVASAAVFVMGQAMELRRMAISPKRHLVLSMLPAILILGAYAPWWLFSPDSPHATEIARERFMEVNCMKSELMIPSSPPGKVTSLYIEPDWAANYTGISGNHFLNYSVGIIAESLVRSGLVQSVESRPYFPPGEGDPPYVRKTIINGKIRTEKIAELYSEYSLIQKTILPEEKAPDVYGKKVIVRDNRTGGTYASVTYFVDTRLRRICIPYHPHRGFSPDAFAMDVLKLRRNNPLVYGKDLK